jgi:hypothetical protein
LAEHAGFVHYPGKELSASVSEVIGKGGQSFVAKEFNVSRDTIRKGLYELNSGFKILS